MSCCSVGTGLARKLEKRMGDKVIRSFSCGYKWWDAMARSSGMGRSLKKGKMIPEFDILYVGCGTV